MAAYQNQLASIESQGNWTVPDQLMDAPLIDAPKKIPNMPNGKRSFVGANLFARLCAEDGLRQSDRANSAFET